MDTLKAIFSRRSVRQFTNKEISDDILENILRAGMSAPSATNEQPWHFLVIKNRQLLNKIPSAHPYATMCTQAQIAIIPCTDTAQEKYKDFWPEDMSAATQNILLAVRASDLGAVWVGVYPNQERVQSLRKLFNLPESVIPFSLIPIGHSDVVQQEVSDRYKKERIHNDRW